jgi:hypothetical protein
MKKILDLIKKIAIVLVVLVVIGAIFGRGGDNDSSSSSGSEGEAAVEQQAEESAAEEEAGAEAEADAEPEPEATADEGPAMAENSDYKVTINGYNIVEDYDGAPCIAVDFTFTNVSDDTPTSMMLATDITVYQDGVECEDAYFSGENSDGFSNKVKAGVSVDVTRTYKLQNTSSDVEVEVGQLSFWSDGMLAYEVFQLS